MPIRGAASLYDGADNTPGANMFQNAMGAPVASPILSDLGGVKNYSVDDLTQGSSYLSDKAAGLVMGESSSLDRLHQSAPPTPGERAYAADIGGPVGPLPPSQSLEYASNASDMGAGSAGDTALGGVAVGFAKESPALREKAYNDPNSFWFGSNPTNLSPEIGKPGGPDVTAYERALAPAYAAAGYSNEALKAAAANMASQSSSIYAQVPGEQAYTESNMHLGSEMDQFGGKPVPYAWNQPPTDPVNVAQMQSNLFSKAFGGRPTGTTVGTDMEGFGKAFLDQHPGFSPDDPSTWHLLGGKFAGAPPTPVPPPPQPPQNDWGSWMGQVHFGPDYQEHVEAGPGTETITTKEGTQNVSSLATGQGQGQTPFNLVGGNLSRILYGETGAGGLSVAPEGGASPTNGPGSLASQAQGTPLGMGQMSF